MITIVVDPKHANILVCPTRVQYKSSRQRRRVREKEKERGRARASLNAKGPQTHEKKRTRSRTTRGNSVRFGHFSRVERFHRCRRSVTDRFGEETTTSSRLCSASWTVVVRLLVSPRKVDPPPTGRSRVSLLSSEAEPTRTDGRDRRGRRKNVQQQRQKTRAASSESVSNGTHSSIESNVRGLFVSYF